MSTAKADGSLFIAVLLGFLNLNLDRMADIKIGLPFVPLGTVALSVALAIKVFHNAEDINKSFRLSTYWVSLGALLNTIGYVLVMEAPGDEYAAAKTAYWQMMRSWRSNLNPELATFTFYATFLMLFAVGCFATMKAIRLYGKVEKEGASNVQA